MSHIVESCPLTKLNGGLSRLHSADEDAVLWLTSYGLRHAYEKEITTADNTGGEAMVELGVQQLWSDVKSNRRMY